MNLRKYIREQISEGISNNDTEILIDKQDLKKAVEQYVVENPEKDLVYVNDLGMRQDAFQILNFIMGNSSRDYLEKIANLIGKDISDFEYQQKKYRSNLGNPSDYRIDSKRDGPLDESVLYEVKPEKSFSKLKDEVFVQVYFKYDFSNSENRLKLMNIIKDYFGEPLSKDRENQYWSTYIPKIELGEFLSMAKEFNPYPSSIEVMMNKFKPLKKELQVGDIIKFFDYTVSDKNPPRAEGYIKEVYKYLSLLKWDGGSKEAFIKKSMIDKYYFYHGDLSDSKNNPGNDAPLDPNNPKIIFDDDQFYGPSSKKVSKKSVGFDDFESGDENVDSYEGNVGEVGYDKYREEELRGLIKKYGGKLEFMFGKDTDSKGRWYTLIPLKNATDFIQAAKQFGAYYGETERNIYLEDKVLNEIRKIVRGVINKVIK